MKKSLGSTKSILDAARDRYYLGEMAKTKASKVSEKSEPQKTVVFSEKDSESSTKEVKKDVSMEKSTPSAESLPKRSVKKGKKVLRKSGDSKVLSSGEVARMTSSKEAACATPSKEVAGNEPLKKVDELSTREGGEESPANLFSLNVSEEVASFNKIFPPDDAASNPSEKKVNSRSPSCSSGEVPLKKRRIEADLLLVENVGVAENKEVVGSVVDEKHQGSTVDVGDRQKEEETPEDIVAADVKTANSSEIEELPAEVIPDLNKENVDRPLQPLNDFPPTDLITISEEHPAATERQEISYEEFQAFRSEMARLKEEVVRLRGDLIDVNGELGKVNRELEKVKAPEGRKSEDFMNGGLCLLQKLVRKGIISPEEALNPSLWN